MKGVFADTSYWIAISNPHDSLHNRARQISRSLPSKRLVTSEMVFAEFLNDFGRRGEFLRRLAARLVARARVDRNVIVVGQTRRQFREALALYSERSDKNWSLTDCASLRIMEQYGIREALTYDRHFEQAGFSALLATTRPAFRYYGSKFASCPPLGDAAQPEDVAARCH